MTDWEPLRGDGLAGTASGPELEPVSLALPLPVRADPPVLVAAHGGAFHVLGRDAAQGQVAHLVLDTSGTVVRPPAGLPVDVLHGLAGREEELLVTGLAGGEVVALGLGGDGQVRWQTALPAAADRTTWPVPASAGRTAVVSWLEGARLHLASVAEGTADPWPIIDLGQTPATADVVALADGRIAVAAATGRPAHLELLVLSRDGHRARHLVPEAAPVGPRVMTGGGEVLAFWATSGGAEAWALRTTPQLAVSAGPARVLAVQPPERLQELNVVADGILAFRVLERARHGGHAVRQAVARVGTGSLALGPPRWLPAPGGSYQGGACLDDLLLALSGQSHPIVSLFRAVPSLPGTVQARDPE